MDATEVLQELLQDPVGKLYVEKASMTVVARHERTMRVEAEKAVAALKKKLPSADG